MTTDRAALLDALLVERYGRNHWWATPETTAQTDDDLTCARRRRELAADFDSQAAKERA
jgi:hypothetical protein